MYIVFCETTEGDGCYVGGVYRSLAKAEARMAWCQNHCLYENDSWHIIEATSQPIKGGHYSDAWQSDLTPGNCGECGEDPEGE